MSPVGSRKKLSDDAGSSSILWKVLISPITLGLVLISRALSVLRPHAPTLIPIVVCSLFIPLILLLSIFSGWYVWSSLSVSWQAPLYLQYGDGVAPHAYAALPNIHPQQRYHISVNLNVPDSEANLALGNFMTTLTVFTAANKTLAHVRRPAVVLPSKSYFFLSKPSTTEIRIPMLESFIPTKANIFASVEIGRRDSWTTLGSGQGREVSISSASIKGLAIPHGIRGIAIRAPFLTSVFSACLFFFILSLTVGSCVLPLILPDMPSEDGEESQTIVKEETMNTPEHPTQEREQRRRRSRSDRTSREPSTRVKVEAPVEAIPSTSTEDPTKGLRRRSSKTLKTPSSDGN